MDTEIPLIGRRPGALRRGAVSCALTFALAFAAVPSGNTATRRVEPWGTTQDGKPVERVAIENDHGMKLAYVDYGATLVSLEVPDRHGKSANVLLSLPNLAAYEHSHRRFASIVGRYAGRIGNARFTLGGRVFQLVPADNGVTLHGGIDGYERRVWARRDFSDDASLGSVFHLVSPDGDQHFPGRLDLRVTYRVMRGRNEFRIEYAATTDAPTVVNLTNHAFFNLAGAGTSGLASHRFRINADRYAQTDELRVPTGVVASVAGTPLDFRRPSGVTTALSAPSEWLGDPPGFDHSLLLAGKDGNPSLAAVVEETSSGRRMEVRTTEPSVQFNSGNAFDGSETDSEGIAYRRYDGFALETQHLSDSPNHAGFPTTVLMPDKTFRSVTSYRFFAQ